jgi:hypothetical protein
VKVEKQAGSLDRMDKIYRIILVVSTFPDPVHPVYPVKILPATNPNPNLINQGNVYVTQW